MPPLLDPDVGADSFGAAVPFEKPSAEGAPALEALNAGAGEALEFGGESNSSALWEGPGINTTCTSPRVWTYDRMLQAWTRSFSFNQGQQVTIESSNLQAIPGLGAVTCGSIPDTIIVVVQGTTSGTIIASNDDFAGGLTGRESRVSFTAPATGYYRVIMFAWGQVSGGVPCTQPGTATVTVTITSVSVQTFPGRVFGGLYVPVQTVYQGDDVFIGKNDNGAGPAASPMYHDTHLHMFSEFTPNCAGPGSCGTYISNDDFDGTLLSRVSANANGSYALLAAAYSSDTWTEGSAGLPTWVNGRMVHAKKHAAVGGGWTAPCAMDIDGDGLSFEVEQQLGLCDLLESDDPNGSVGIETSGATCGAYWTEINGNLDLFDPPGTGTRCPEDEYEACSGQPHPPGLDPRCFHPCDSDHDGLRDDEEIFVRRTVCTQQPTPLVGDAGTCTPARFQVATATGAYVTRLALSAEDEPSPRVPDLYVELDALTWPLTGPVVATTALHPANQLPALIARFEDFGRRCADGSEPPCPNGEPSYFIDLHVVQEEHRVPYRPRNNEFWWDGGSFMVNAGYNRSSGAAWNHGASRKYTGVYRYGLLTWNEGGTAESGNRFFVAGVSEPTSTTAPYAIAHEMGHLLGLSHLGWPTPSGQCGPMNITYHSIMNYQYQAMVPLQDPFTAGIGACSAANTRFSKGLGNSLPGSVLDELQMPGIHAASDPNVRRFLADQTCFDNPNTDGGDPCERHYGNTICDGGVGVCCVDWDQDNVACEWGTSRLDVDRKYSYSRIVNWLGSDGVNDNDRLLDMDDWAKMAVWLGSSPPRTAETDYHVYASGFNDDTTFNFDGWSFAVTAPLPAPDGLWPVNRCNSGADCPTNARRLDYCGGCCPTASCQGPVCGCTSDADCWSGRCMSSGTCDIGDGRCACFSDADCPQVTTPGACANLLCRSEEVRGYEEALQFSTASSTSLQLSSAGGASNPVTLLPGGAQFDLDIRPGGLAAGQVRQVLLNAGFLTVALVPAGSPLSSDMAVIVRNGAGTEVLRYPAAGQAPLDKNWWYQLRVVHRPGESRIDISLRRWLANASAAEDHFNAFGPETCVTRSGITITGSATDVRIGGGTTSTERYVGFVDNVNIYRGRKDNLENCVVIP